jgi:predicted metal-dependent phosphotriesterase family hydrolase
MLYSGFENNIMLSLDITRERLRSQGFSIMQKYFIPKLKKRGIKQNIIDRFFIDNPAAVLNKE